MADWKIEKARKKVRSMKGFYTHLASWVIFSVFMITMNLVTDPFEFWAIFPIMAWGVGLAFHALGVFGIPGLGKDWEERQMQKELDRLDRLENYQQEPWEEEYESHSSPASRYSKDFESGLELKELERRKRDNDFV